MSFKKVIQSDRPIVIGHHENDVNLFPVGFEYRVGGIIYKVKEDVTKDNSSPMRRVQLSDGNTEILTIESIKMDLKEHDASIINDPSKAKEASKESPVDFSKGVKGKYAEEFKSVKTEPKEVSKKKVSKKKKNGKSKQ